MNDETMVSKDKMHLEVGRAVRKTFERLAKDLAIENAKQLDYIDDMLVTNQPRGEMYRTQWRDGVEGQARVLYKWAPVPSDYDIEEFYNESGFEGTHQNLSGIEQMFVKYGNSDD
jgi:hypothetical protein